MAEHNSLKKNKIGIFGVIGMIYAMTAAGAYGIEDMVSASGPGMAIIMLFVLPLIWAFPIALSSSELGSAIPEECGYYKWVQRALGEYWGFQVGWLKDVGIFINNAVFVVLAGDYVASYLHLSSAGGYALKVVIILIFMVINLRGVKEVAIVSTLISAFIVIAFAGIAIIGFTHMHYNPFEPVLAEGTTVVGSIGASIAIGMWMYAGYETMSSLAGELENPQIIPKGIILALPLIIATYVVPTVASVGSIGQWDAWGSDGVSYINVALEYAPAFAVLFVTVAFASNISMFNVYLATGARNFFIIAEDNLFPKFLCKVSKKYGTPYVTIVGLSLVSIVLCFLSFSALVTAVALLNMGFYSLILISQIVLRKKEPDLPRPFKIKLGGDIGNMIFCSIPIAVAFIALYINGTDYFVGGLLAMCSGPVAYLIFKPAFGGLYKKDPSGNPINRKTKLAAGDTKRIALTFALIAVLFLIGRVFLPWYEDPAYYTDIYNSATIFDTFMNVTLISGIACAVIAVIFAVIGFNVEKKEYYVGM